MWIKKLILWFSNCVWWPTWSNIRWRKERRLEAKVSETEHAETLAEIRSLVRDLDFNFEWTADGIDQLGDSICPPAYNYIRWKAGVLKDDCDGFHSLVYHCLQQSNVECYLLAVTHLKGGHCVLLFKLDDKWYVNDYSRVHAGYNSPQEAIEAYNAIYLNTYENGVKKYLYNALTSFNYSKHKFRSVKVKKLK